MKKTSKGFNWKGITQNQDGSFTAQGKIEKRRLLKSLHASGYTVRSKRTDEGWKVTAVGSIRQVKRRSAPVGYRPRTRYTSSSGRYTPISGRYVPIRNPRMMNRGPAPRPTIRPGGPSQQSGQRPGIMQTLFDRNRAKQGQGPQSKQARIAESKKVEAEMAARSKGPSTRIKSRQEIIQSHNETRMQRARMKSEQQERSAPSAMTHTYAAGSQTVTTHYEPKIDQSKLQSEREHEITGE